MKFLLRPDSSRIHKQDTWKKSAYAFVPNQTHFGELCGFADDIVNGGEGFGMHPHQNMEITTIMLNGSQKHKDNLGNEGFIDANSVQTMSAGVGIVHSEFNASQIDSFHSYQIWVYPKKMDVRPRHQKFSFQQDAKLNKVLLTISPDGRNETALINQDAFFSLSRLEASKELIYTINLQNNGVYIHCASGSVQIEKYSLKSGDALGVYDTERFIIKATQEAELILVEVPMHRGVKVNT